MNSGADDVFRVGLTLDGHLPEEVVALLHGAAVSRHVLGKPVDAIELLSDEALWRDFLNEDVDRHSHLLVCELELKRLKESVEL